MHELKIKKGEAGLRTKLHKPTFENNLDQEAIL